MQGNNRFKPHLNEAGKNDELIEQNSSDLSKRYKKAKKQEIKVERKPVRIMSRGWDILTLIIGGIFAVIGILVLLDEGCRNSLILLFTQFLSEIRG